VVLAGSLTCLTQFSPGDLIRIGWLSRGVLDVAPVDATGEGDAEVESLRAAFEQLRRPGEPAMLLDVLVAACRARADVLVNAPPLEELLQRAGLSRQGDEVADADFDWPALTRARHHDFVDDLAERYDLELRRRSISPCSW
jgi:hypothetical protein